MTHEMINTDDRGEAMSFLARLLDSPELVNAQIRHLDGAYSIEVSRPTNECGDDPISPLLTSSPLED